MTNFEKIVQGGADALHEYRITRNCGKICSFKECKQAGGNKPPLDFNCHVGQYKWLISDTKAEMTAEEKTLLQGMVLAGYKWAARDKCGKIYFYTSKPVKLIRLWHNDMCGQIPLFGNLPLCFIQWSDPEPINITELLDSEK